jgi:hypothetical protein
MDSAHMSHLTNYTKNQLVLIGPVGSVFIFFVITLPT